MALERRQGEVVELGMLRLAREVTIMDEDRHEHTRETASVGQFEEHGY